MKKLFLGVLSALMLGAILYVVLRGERDEEMVKEKPVADRVASIEHVLPLDRTVLFVGLEGVPTLLTNLVGTLDNVPAEERPELLQTELWNERYGFDPQAVDEWSGVGVDINRGLYLARVHLGDEWRHPHSIFLLPLSNSDALVKAMTRWGLDVQLADHPLDSVQTLSLNGRAHLVGFRGDYVAVVAADPPMEVDDTDEFARAFQSFLHFDGPTLSDDTNTFLALNNESGVYGLFGVFQGNVWGKQLSARGELSDTRKEWIEDMPMIGLVCGEAGTALRVLGKKHARGALETMFTVESEPALSRFVPHQGWAALRLSVNLSGLLDGLSDLLPPSMAKERLLLSGLPTLLGVRGIEYDKLVKALDGHLLLAVPTADYIESVSQKPLFRKEFIFAASVKDTALTDELLVNIVGVLARESEQDVEALTIEGSKGMTWMRRGRQMVLIRIGQTVFYASNPSHVTAVLGAGSGATLQGSVMGESLDDPSKVLVHTLNFDEMRSYWQHLPKMLQAAISQLGVQTLSLGLRNGLELRLDGPDGGMVLLYMGLVFGFP